MRRAWLSGALGCLLAASALSSAFGQSDFYKGKTVSVVIGAKGGSLSVSAQILAQHLGKHIPGNPSVIFVQMPGGAHLGATGHVYNVTDPDGLTVLAANPNVAVAQLAKLPQVRFDIRKFEWLGSSGPDGAMLAIRADLPYKNLAEMIAFAKQKPGEVVFGSTGNGTGAHLAGEKFFDAAGIQVNHIPFSGIATAVTAAVGGNADMVIGYPIAIMPQVAAGKLRPIAVFSEARSPLLPEVPTLAEAGWPAAEVVVWAGIMAPAGTPRTIVRQLERAFVDSVQLPDVRERMTKLGADPVGNGAKAFAEVLEKDLVLWQRVAQASGVKVE